MSLKPVLRPLPIEGMSNLVKIEKKDRQGSPKTGTPYFRLLVCVRGIRRRDLGMS